MKRDWSRRWAGLLPWAVIGLVLCDVVYPLACAWNLRAYDLAPKTDYLAAEDDAGYFDSGLGAGLAWLARDIAVLLVLVAVVAQLRNQRRAGERLRPILLGLAATAIFAVEVFRETAPSGYYPDLSALILVICVCAANVVLALAVFAVCRRPRSDHPQPVTQLI